MISDNKTTFLVWKFLCGNTETRLVFMEHWKSKIVPYAFGVFSEISGNLVTAKSTRNLAFINKSKVAETSKKEIMCSLYLRINFVLVHESYLLDSYADEFSKEQVNPTLRACVIKYYIVATIFSLACTLIRIIVVIVCIQVVQTFTITILHVII